MAELSRQEIEDIGRQTGSAGGALCDTALAAKDRADNLAFELQLLERARLENNTYLIERAEKAERELAATSAWRASVRDETLEEAAALVEDEGPCRHVDHLQDICACLAKAAMIRAMKGGKS